MSKNSTSMQAKAPITGAPTWSFSGPPSPAVMSLFAGAKYVINVSYTSDKAIAKGTIIKFKSSTFSWCVVTPKGGSVIVGDNTVTATFIVYGMQGSDKPVDLIFTTEPSAGADGTMHINLFDVTPSLWERTFLSFENTFVKDIDGKKLLHSTLDINVILNNSPIPYACFYISTNGSSKDIEIYKYGKKDKEDEYLIGEDNTYLVMADKDGQVKLDFYPVGGFTGVVRPEAHFGPHSKYGQNSALFVTSQPKIKYSEPTLEPMDGDNLVSPVESDQKFTVIVDPKVENISGDKVIIIADHYDDSIKIPSTLLLCEQDFLEGDKPDIIEIPYSLLTEQGDYVLSYMISEESGNVSASSDLFFTLKTTLPNKPDPSKTRIFSCPVIVDSKNREIPSSSSIYINKESIEFDGLSLTIFLDAKLISVGTVIKAVVYLNGFVNNSWASSQYCTVFKDTTGQQDVDSYTITQKDLDMGFVKGKIPYLKLTGWDSQGYKPGSIYLEWFTSDKSRYSQIWGALLDTVEPGG